MPFLSKLLLTHRGGKQGIDASVQSYRGGNTRSPNEYEAAMADFLRNNSVTRCPTACVVPTHGNITEADQAALRDYTAAMEMARIEKLRIHRR